MDKVYAIILEVAHLPHEWESSHLIATCTHYVKGACLKTGLPENGNSWENIYRLEANILLSCTGICNVSLIINSLLLYLVLLLTSRIYFFIDTIPFENVWL